MMKPFNNIRLCPITSYHFLISIDKYSSIEFYGIIEAFIVGNLSMTHFIRHKAAGRNEVEAATFDVASEPLNISLT